jgi:hypothetical protein
MKIVVCTIGINDCYIDVVKYSFRSIEKYCALHGYESVIYKDNEDPDKKIYDGKRAPQWYKIKLIKDILMTKDCDYVFWIDADCQILRHDVKLEYFIEKYCKPETEVLITQESTGFNTGVMFFKKSDFNIQLLDKIWNTGTKYFESFHEQCSFNSIYENDEEVRSKMVIVPYGPKDEIVVYWGNYFPNKNFLIHLAGCACGDKLSFMYMMDTYYIFKLDEESEEDYKIRLDWLLNENKCRPDIDKWLRKENTPRIYSERCKKVFLHYY